MTFLKRAWLAMATVLALLPGRARPAELSPEKWTFSETDTGKPLGREVADGDINTAWISPAPVKPGTGITIDLGQEVVVDRLYFTPGKAQGATPKSLKVVLEGNAGGAPTALNATLPAGKRDIDLFFEPVATRRVRVEVAAASDQPWAIAELEIHGSSDPAAFHPSDAVILGAKAPAPLRGAAEELSYYIGELTGTPLPIVTPEQSGNYPGTLYRIVDLKSLATTWEQLQESQASGKFPATPVNVERNGREVIFKAWPYANVRASVWAFLEKQGIRWVYPDEHGDLVPTGKGVNLDCLPLRFTPCASRRFANFDSVQKTTEAAAAANEPSDPVSLFWYRNGYNSTWAFTETKVLGGAEVPKDPHGWIPWDKRKHDDYEEGFDGYPHNFDNVIPKRILEKHPDWWGEVDGKRVAPWQGGPMVCMTNPGLIQFVIDKALAFTDSQSTVTLDLLPMDAAKFCDCERCRAFYEPLFRSRVPHSEIRPFEASDAYYYMVAQVANGIRPTRPGVRIFALAYADLLEPPRKLARLPDNVTVEICALGAPELPMSSPLNEPLRTCIQQWHAKCASLEHYEYAILNESKVSTVMPVPLVSAMVDHARFYRSIGAVNGGTQADSQSIGYSPWNQYAYPRLMRDPDLTAKDLLNEFFTGYFREASEPMLAYYRTLEDHLIHDDASLRPPSDDHSGVFAYGVKPGSFPYGVLVKMRAYLQVAEKHASSWIVADRVARIREGFDWVMTESAYTPADLDDPSAFESVPADGTSVTLDLTKVKLHKQWVEPRKQGGWMFASHGTLGVDMRINTPGEYVVTMTVKGERDGNLDPLMNVYIDSHHAGRVTVESGEPKELTFRQAFDAAGVSRILITYWHTGAKGTQHLHIEQVRVARAPAGGVK